MFTGLVEGVGRVAGLDAAGEALRLHIETPLADAVPPGESIAVNGVCLTVVEAVNGRASFDVGPETLRTSTIGSWMVGRRVNLERALQAGQRFGGHFVQGHVDGAGIVLAMQPDGDVHWLRCGFPKVLAPYFVSKGSVAIDGVSLTVARLGYEDFDIMIVPFTWEHTALSDLVAGEHVNLECDLIGKYVVRAVQTTGVETP